MKGRLLTAVLSTVLTAFSIARGETMHSYYLTSSMMTRSLAMGGAFTAVRDGWESCLYNPAAMINEDERLQVAVDPLGLAALTGGIERLSVRSSLTPIDYIAAAGLALRSISLAYGPLQAITLLSEELSASPFRNNDHLETAGEGIADWSYHLAAVRLTPAKQIALGGAVLFFNQSDDQEGKYRINRSVGSSYGILISPSDRFTVGAAVFNLPERARSAMEYAYQMDRQDVNFGLSWMAFEGLQLAVDFRKVTQEDSTDSMHFHGGVEMTPFPFLTLRAGYFQEKETKITAGFGFGDFRRVKSKDFIFGKIMLNYCLQTGSPSAQPNFEHRLAFLIRL